MVSSPVLLLYRFQVSTWFFTTFSVSGMKDKVRYLDGLQQLFTCVRPEQIDIPPFVLEYDSRVNTNPTDSITMRCCRSSAVR